MVINSNTQKIRSILKKNSLDAFLVTGEVNVSYLSGLPITDTCILITRNKNIIITDFRYASEAKTLKGFSSEIIDGAFLKTFARLIRKFRLSKIGFEGKILSYEGYKNLKKSAKKASLISTKGIVEYARMVKAKDEIRNMRQAVEVSKAVFTYIKRVLKPGLSELELAQKIDIYIRSRGADGEAFPTIVASGPNSARPHAAISKRKIKRGEPVIVDLGVKMDGYNSDLTRTFYLGKIDAKFNKIYDIAYSAQKRAINLIKPGVSISKIDQAARSVIDRAGFGERFGHALGHGIGMEVHESPKIFKGSKGRLLPGMIFTVEPGVYIPGWGGVRIEDMVLVTNKGCEVLTGDIDKSI